MLVGTRGGLCVFTSPPGDGRKPHIGISSFRGTRDWSTPVAGKVDSSARFGPASPRDNRREVRYGRTWIGSLRRLPAPVSSLPIDGGSRRGVLRPYVLATENPGVVADVVAQTRASLAQAGFEIVGEYPLSDAADVIVITSDALRAAAAKTPDGGFGPWCACP